MTQLHPRDPETDNRTDFRNGASRKKQLQPVEWVNKTKLVSVDLIGEKNQVILELQIMNATRCAIIIDP